MRKLLTIISISIFFFLGAASVHADAASSHIRFEFNHSSYAEGDAIYINVFVSSTSDFFGVQFDISENSMFGFPTEGDVYDDQLGVFGGTGNIADQSISLENIATYVAIRNDSSVGYVITEEVLLVQIHLLAVQDITDIQTLLMVTDIFDDLFYQNDNLCLKLASSTSSSIPYTVSFDILFIDIALFGNSEMTVEVNSSFTDPGCDYDASLSLVVEGNVDLTKVGTYQLSYTVQSTTGATSQTLTRTVHVVDTTAPTYTYVSEFVLHVSTTPTNLYTFVTNVVDNSGIAPTVVITSNITDYNIPGVYSAIITVTDSSGNTNVKTMTITIQDITAPTIVGEDEYTFVVGEVDSYDYLANVTITDNIASAPQTRVVGNVDYDTAGDYTIDIVATDSSGNATTFHIFVHILGQFTVTFYSSDGTKVVHVETVIEGETVESYKYTAIGYRFISWKLNGSDYDFSTPVTSDLSLIANMEKTSGCLFGFSGDISFFTISLTFIGLFVLVYRRK